ncbi:MAG: family transcriptional regulator, partial [Marmoricola sp.]|nr:family transcriptional regulator [Marmoricola sp.]
MSNHDRSSICIRSLGKPSAELNGVPVADWRMTKVMVLLHYLLDRRGRAVDRVTLINALWSDQNVSAPEVSLKVAIHDLRRTLESIFGPQAGLRIATHECGYLLEAERVWYDVEEFEGKLAGASQLNAIGQTAEALEWYTEAVNLYRGDFLSGVGGDWTLRRRHALVDRYLGALLRLSQADFTAHQYDRCIAYCIAALGEDPCAEWPYQLLMSCHARLGQFGRLHAWWRLCTE